MMLLKQFASRRNGCDDDAGAFGARTRRHRRIHFIVTKPVASSLDLGGPRTGVDARTYIDLLLGNHLHGTNVTSALGLPARNASEGRAILTLRLIPRLYGAMALVQYLI
jgi:hypothetical protein